MRRINIDLIELALVRVSMLSLLLMMFIIFFDVFGRFVFNTPITGAKEVIEFTMIFLVYFGLSYTQSKNGHVGMDLFIDIFKRNKGKFYYFLLTINSLVSISVAAFLIIFSYSATLNVYKRGVLSIYLQWPMWIMSLAMLLGMVLLLIRLLKEFTLAIKSSK